MEYPSRECKHDIKESKGNTFNPIFKENVQGQKHPGSCVFAERELSTSCIVHEKVPFRLFNYMPVGIWFQKIHEYVCCNAVKPLYQLFCKRLRPIQLFKHGVVWTLRDEHVCWVSFLRPTKNIEGFERSLWNWQMIFQNNTWYSCSEIIICVLYKLFPFNVGLIVCIPILARHLFKLSTARS